MSDPYLLKIELGEAKLEIDTVIGDADEYGIDVDLLEIRHEGNVVWNQEKDGRIVAWEKPGPGQISYAVVGKRLLEISKLKELFMIDQLRMWRSEAVYQFTRENEEKSRGEPYTVLLIYPDYLAENYGEDFYTAYVRAKDPKEAITLAQQEAILAQDYYQFFDPNLDGYCPLADFAVVAVFAGKHQNIKPEPR